MSTNSAGGTFGTPHLAGYTLRWDDDAQEWVARCNDFPDTVLRGKDQPELEAARGRLVLSLAEDLRRIIAYAPNHGYSPPPR